MVQLLPFHIFWRKNYTVPSGEKLSPVFPVKRKGKRPLFLVVSKKDAFRTLLRLRLRWLHGVILHCPRKCYDLNTVFLSSLSRLLFFKILNYGNVQKLWFFLPLYGFVIIFNFLRWNLPNFSQHIASSGIRILNTQKGRVCKGRFSEFCKLIYVFYRCEKTGLIDLPEKMSSD